MNLPISETIRFQKAGIKAARSGEHTCAGTCPIVIRTIGINPESPELPAIIEAWDMGYMAERAVILANINQEKFK